MSEYIIGKSGNQNEKIKRRYSVKESYTSIVQIKKAGRLMFEIYQGENGLESRGDNLDEGAKMFASEVIKYIDEYIEEREQVAKEKVFIDIPTGHKITEMTSKLAKHNPECSSTQGFMCDCEIMDAALYAVSQAKNRISDLQTKENK